MWIGVGPIPRSAAIIDMPVVRGKIGLKYGEIWRVSDEMVCCV